MLVDEYWINKHRIDTYGMQHTEFTHTVYASYRIFTYHIYSLLYIQHIVFVTYCICSIDTEFVYIGFSYTLYAVNLDTIQNMTN